jgi:hypothetical protein
MQNKAIRTGMTFAKSMFWYGVAAALDYAVTHLTNLNIPLALVPIVGFVLKSIATWVATQKD